MIFNVKQHFEGFDKELRTSKDDIENINNRIKVITKIINQSYWNSDSEHEHKLLVGSYGRGTAIHLSDIDLLVELPSSQKQRFEEYIHNGQSALLQDIKNKLLKHYSKSTIKGDGQIVSIEFSDGIRFEILPAFSDSKTHAYTYPDTHDGGKWKITNPKLEQNKLNERNKEHSGAVKKLCRMLRAWNDENNVGLHGIAIDSLCYVFFISWDNKKNSFQYFDELSYSFFKWLSEFISTKKELKSIDDSYIIELHDIKTKINKSCKLSDKAREFKEDNEKIEKIWRKIYGNKFPKTYASSLEKNTLNSVISNRATRTNIGAATDTEQFADELGWNLDVVQKIEIHSSLNINGFRKEAIDSNKKIVIKPNSKILFSVDNIPKLKWYWKIRNVGEVANKKDMIRGQIVKGTTRHEEPINFRGNHYVEVYGVDGDVVKVFGKTSVLLEENIW